MTKKIKDIIIGVVLVIVGIIFLGNELDFWKIELLFDGWWTLIIIIPSALGLFQHGSKLSSALGLLIGMLLLLASRGKISWSEVGRIFLPSMLVLIGLSVIFKKNFKLGKIKNKDDITSYIAIFSGSEDTVSGEEFTGANITAIFGGVELNLKNAIINQDIVINCTTVFGGIDLALPDNVKVKTSGVPIFGGIENKRESTKEDKVPTVYINYISAFAGIDLI
jgi:predicted membrane protein